MKFYLSSYKLGNYTEYLKEWINIDSNNKKIILITNARDTKEQNEEELEKIKQNVFMLEDIGFEVIKIDLKDYFGQKDKLDKVLDSVNSYCVIGGNVFVLRKAMELSGFDKYLLDNKNNEKLYIGYSAGSCVLSPNLEGLNLVDEPINPYDESPVNYNGLGMIDYCFVPHYKSNHKESLLIDELVEYLYKNNIKYKTLRDGDVIFIN